MATQRQRYPRYFYPFYWPFTIARWPSRLWWLFLLDYVPVVNLIILRGWRLSVVRRIAWGEEPSLPPLNIPRYLRDGAFLWALTFIYTLVPLGLFAYLGIGGLVELGHDTQTFWRILTGQESMTLRQFITVELSETLMRLGIEIAWVAISIPMHRAAMIRFAVTGRYRSFLHIPANALFLLRNMGGFISLAMFSLMTAVLMIAGSALISLTVVGAALLPLITLPIYYWSTAYEFGELAYKLRKRTCPDAFPPARIMAELADGPPLTSVAARAV